MLTLYRVPAIILVAHPRNGVRASGCGGEYSAWNGDDGTDDTRGKRKLQRGRKAFEDNAPHRLLKFERLAETAA